MKLARTFATAATLIIAPLLVLTPAACGIVQYSSISATAERTQSISDANSLTVDTRNGTIDVTRDDSSAEVVVTAKIRCGGGTQAEADQRLAEAKLNIERQSDGAVRVAVVFPNPAEGGKKFGNDGASFTIRAPGSLTSLTLNSSNGAISSEGFKGTLAAKTSNGAVTISNHDGPVTVDTSNGRVKALNVTGPLSLESSNGAMEVELRDGSTQNVKVDSSNGKVELTLPASWNGAMSAKTSNGKVSVEADEGRATNVATSKGTGTATIGAGTATANLHTSNGAIRVKVKGG